MRASSLIFLALAVALACAETVVLTSDNFEEKTKEGKWLVKFYAPWCGHCKKLAPTWEHVGKELAGKANIGMIDCTSHKEVCSKFEVKGYPTIKLLSDGADFEKFSGARTSAGIVKFLQDKAGLDASVTVSEVAGAAPAKPAPKAEEVPAGPTAVKTLTEANFADTIKEGHWFVKFYAPWCGHCKKLAPTWDDLSVQLEGKANIAKVDCTTAGSLCSDNGVKGYPTLKLFKDGQDVDKHSGPRDVAAFGKYLQGKGVIGEDVVVKGAGSAKPAVTAKTSGGAKVEVNVEENTDVIILTDENYASSVQEGAWLIKYYAPWCGHCKKLAPTWDKLATNINKSAGNKVKIAKVDCTVHKSVCTSNGVKGYPTLKLIQNGESEQYQGKRDMDAFTTFLADKGLFGGEKAAHAEL